MPTIKMWLNASALGINPDARHMAETRLKVDRALDMVPKSRRSATEASIGTVLAARTIHQPQVIGIARRPSGKVMLVWGSVGNKDGDFNPLTAEQLVKMAGEDGNTGAVRIRVEGCMVSPDTVSEPEEDVIALSLECLAAGELEEEITEERLTEMESGTFETGGL